METAEGGLGHQRAAVEAHAAEALGGPGGVAREELVVFGGAELAVHAQVEDVVVDQLLGGFLGEDAGLQVALDVDVEEGGRAAQAHGRAVLLLDGREVAEVDGLDGLAGALGGLGDVVAVHLGHFLEAAEVVDLAPHVLAQADGLVVHHRVGRGADAVEILLLLLDQPVHAIERHAAVVADDAAAAVGIGQAGEHVGGAQRAHVLGVRAEDAVVVRGAVGELRLQLLAEAIAIGLRGLDGHAHAAEGVDGALQRRIRLQPHDQLVFLVQVTRGMVEQAGGVVHIHVEHAAFVELLLVEPLVFGVHLAGARRGADEERRVPLVGRVVGLDEIADIDAVLPLAGLERSVLEHGRSSLFGLAWRPRANARKTARKRRELYQIQNLRVKPDAAQRGDFPRAAPAFLARVWSFGSAGGLPAGGAGDFPAPSAACGRLC